jgi:tetratricopeptide (TPR) repeat protein
MAELEEAARSGRAAVVLALAGARGVGKTQLAAAYARQCAAQGWPLVAWVNAESRDQLLADLDLAAEAIGVRVEGEDSALSAGRVRDWLSGQAQRCLVVFDNLAEVDAVESWLPAVGQAQIVITTTQRAARALGTLVSIDVFSPDEAVAFLSERTGRDDEQGARRLAEEVGRLPLALSQASWVIAQQGMSYEEYVQRLRAVALEQELRPVRGERYPHGAAEAVLLSLKQLGRGRRVRLERALLDLLAVLSPAGVPREWLHLAAREGLLGKIGRDGRDVVGLVNAGIGRLAESSLVTLSVDGTSIRTHGFIQRVLRDSARMREDLDAILAAATQLVKANAVQLERVALDRPQMETFVQQATALWLNVDHPASASPERLIHMALSLRNRAGRYLQAAGDLSRAIPLYEQNLTDRERVLGPTHPDTLASRNNLAYAYTSAGRLDDALPLLEQNLTDSERVLGPNHPDTLASRNNFAFSYLFAGRHDDAIPLFEQTLTDSERVLGPNHPDTLASRNNLAGAYESAGRHDDAIPLYNQNPRKADRSSGFAGPD